MTTYRCLINYPKEPYSPISSLLRLVLLSALILSFCYWQSFYMIIPVFLIALALPAICSVIVYGSIHPKVHSIYRSLILSLVHVELFLLGIHSTWRPFADALKPDADIEIPPANYPLKRSYLILKPFIILPALILLMIASVLLPFLLIVGLIPTLFKYDYPKKIHHIVSLFYIYYLKILYYGLFFLTDEWPSFKLSQD
ncbi:MAG TPA: hypothetical protein QF353_06205 [Gammaproteobacteria bacterium]|nr:hypothetical protein [Gammaproteobacteria bacterium]